MDKIMAELGITIPDSYRIAWTDVPSLQHLHPDDVWTALPEDVRRDLNHTHFQVVMATVVLMFRDSLIREMDNNLVARLATILKSSGDS